MSTNMAEPVGGGGGGGGGGVTGGGGSTIPVGFAGLPPEPPPQPAATATQPTTANVLKRAVIVPILTDEQAPGGSRID